MTAITTITLGCSSGSQKKTTLAATATQ